jgi:uncharacterized protein (DUF488 family)
MGQQVFSIGYGGRERQELVAQLLAAGVDCVVDVRSSPFSKYQPEFSGNELRAYLPGQRLRYLFMGDQLGGRPPSDDCYSDGKVDYTRVREKDFFRLGIDRLLNGLQRGYKICLMCSEAHPGQCHRSKLIGVALQERSVQVTHLMKSGDPMTQDRVISELTSAQETLFGEAFGSRKAYK